jgi:type III restriction enzyme
VVKKMTMGTYCNWVPGVNHAGKYGRWAFAKFTNVYEMQDDFAEKVKAHFDHMIAAATTTND